MRNMRVFLIATVLWILPYQFSAADDIEISGLYSVLPFSFTVPEGSVGILHRGSFLASVYSPGVYFLPLSLITDRILVNVRPQIDVIKDIPCGTADGLTINFPRVAVYNQLKEEHVMSIIRRFGEDYDHYLITEPVVQAVAELCTSMTARELYIDKFSGLNEELMRGLIKEQENNNSQLVINRVVISKPVLPGHIQNNYEELVNQKSLLEVAIEKQARAMKEIETQRLRKAKEAETQRQVAEIESLQRLAQEKSLAEQEKVRVDVRVHQLRQEADAEAYSVQKQAEATAFQIVREGEARGTIVRQEAEVNKELLTPAYIEKVRAESFWVSPNTKYYFGNQIPSFMYSAPDAADAVPAVSAVRRTLQTGDAAG